VGHERANAFELTAKTDATVKLYQFGKFQISDFTFPNENIGKTMLFATFGDSE
jgi:hypothetical protein